MQKKLNHMFSFFSPFQKWRTQQSLNHVFLIDIGHRTKGIKWVTIHLHSKYTWIMSIAILQLIIEKSSAKLRFWFCMAAYYSLASKRQRELELWFLSLQEVNGLGFTLVQWVGSYRKNMTWWFYFILFLCFLNNRTECAKGIFIRHSSQLIFVVNWTWGVVLMMIIYAFNLICFITIQCDTFSVLLNPNASFVTVMQ